MKEEKLKESLMKIVENQEEIQEVFGSIGSPEEGLELPHNPQWLKEEIEDE